ncbi:MAG: VOC family protein [Frankiales bacterium]|nr:VOC family protein [Frankiales bacterium]
MVVASRGVVTLDCAEPGPLAQFWADVLGGRVVHAGDAAVVVRTEWVAIAAMRVEGYVPPTWPAADVPKQVHLDLAVDDLEPAVAEAVRLGATVAAHQPAPGLRRILLDPAGHPFCLTTQVPPAAL